MLTAIERRRGPVSGIAELLRKPGVSQAEPRLFEGALNRLLDLTGELKNVGKPGGRGGKGGRRRYTSLALVQHRLDEPAKRSVLVYTKYNGCHQKNC
jgi:hypothetical protein